MYGVKSRKRSKHKKTHVPGEGQKWHFPFCFILSNQAGTVVLSFQGITLMIVTMLYNWYADSSVSTSTRLIQNLMLHVYLFVMIAGYILAFLSAYLEVSKFAKIAAYLIGIGTIIYIVYFILSFLTKSMIMLYVCPEMRCADHHWLQDALWRGFVVYTDDTDIFREIDNEIRRIETRGGHPYRIRIKNTLKDRNMNSTFKYIFLQDSDNIGNYFPGFENKTPWIEDETKPPPVINGHYIRVLSARDEGNIILIVVSVIFTLVILGFFLYAVVTFYAYGMQLMYDV